MNAPETDERAGLPSASFSIRYKCLGSWNLVQACKKAGVISNDGGAAAESGTLIHAARSGEALELTDSQEDMKETLERIERQTMESLYPGMTLYARERRIWLRRGFKPIFSGKYDAAYFNQGGLYYPKTVPETAVIWDDKTGRLEVDAAERNLQMRDLAALWHSEHVETRQMDVVISQPLISHTPSIARFDFEELVQALELLDENLEQIANPYAPRTPGHHCRHCPARGFCEEAKAWGVAAPQDFAALVKSNVMMVPLGDPGKELLERIDVGYKILDQLWTCYEEAVKSKPGCIPGWHMAEGYTVERIVDFKAMMVRERGLGNTAKKKNKASLKPVSQRKKALK